MTATGCHIAFADQPGAIDPIAKASAQLKHDIRSAIAAFRVETGITPAAVQVDIVSTRHHETGRPMRYVSDVRVTVEV